MSDEHDVRDSHIQFTPRHYMTLSGVIAILLWVIAATAYLLDKFEVAPLKSELQKNERTIAETQSNSQALKADLEQTLQAYQAVLEGTKAPILTYPADGATVIGDQITFRWAYANHTLYQKYMLEIRAVSGTNNQHQILNVLNPETRTMFFPTERLRGGEYLWRIIPGYRLNGNDIVQGVKSNYNTLSLYGSVIDRIRDTNEIRVGTFNRSGFCTRRPPASPRP